MAPVLARQAQGEVVGQVVVAGGGVSVNVRPVRLEPAELGDLFVPVGGSGV